jgi:fructokinase
MERKYDVIALGELLIDFTDNGLSSQGNPLLETNPGGAPCNVLSMLAKLSKKTAFIGKVGKDMFGRQLRETIKAVGIDDSYLLDDEKVHTTLAFVKTYENGDRDFSFYRDPGADMMLKEADLPLDALKNTKVFHFGTLSMTHEEVRKATKKAVETAKAAGAMISFDPNLRPPLWADLDEAKEQIDWGLRNSDIVKIADNELQFMCGEEDLEKCAQLLKEKYPNIKVLNATYGAEGSCSYYKDLRVFVPAFKLGGTIETTGAGDTFCASAVNYIIDHPIDELNEKDLKEMLRFANAAAYIVTTKKGAIRSMPDPEDVEEILKNN